VLRVLFSKINSAESNKVSNGMAAMQSLPQLDGNPVFISQGALAFQEQEMLAGQNDASTVEGSEFDYRSRVTTADSQSHTHEDYR